MNIEDLEVGQTFTVDGFIVTRLTPSIWGYSDRYSVYQGSSQIIQAIIGRNMFPSSTLSTGVLTTASAFSSRSSLTPEEDARLSELEIQATVHIKFEQLKKFKGLPCHLRQEIVDESYIKDLMNTFENNSNESSFQFSDELNTLRGKRSNYYHGLSAALSSYGHTSAVHYGMKYTFIFNKFTTEELAKAHAEVCLEESIQN